MYRKSNAHAGSLALLTFKNLALTVVLHTYACVFSGLRVIFVLKLIFSERSNYGIFIDADGVTIEIEKFCFDKNCHLIRIDLTN